MNTYQLIVHRPTNHAFRAVYFDGSYECFKEIEDLIYNYYNGFLETWCPIKIYHQFNGKKYYSVNLPANHWMIVSFSEEELKEKYGISRYISDDEFNKLFKVISH